MQTLETIVTSAQAGNLEAFSTLVTRFQNMAFATAFTLLGNVQLAEDVAQEAFLEAYIHLTQLETPAAFPAWLRTIVMRQTNRLTRRKSLTTVSIDVMPEFPAPDTDLLVLMAQREIQETVQQVIASLPERERQVTLLFYIGDYSQPEIAAYLDVPITTVKSRLHTARTHLRERMIQMVEDNLQQKRPSKDERFVQEVIEVIEATEQGDLSKLNQLLERNPRLAQAKDERPDAARATALHYAAWSGHQEIAGLLLSYGADIDLYDETYDAPPIGWAGENGQNEMFDFLLEKGARINISQAAAYGELSLVKSFVEKDPGSVHFGTKDSHEGWSPLWSSSFWQCKETVEYFLANGTDINAPTRHGERPLHGAVMGKDPSIIELLLRQGAEINAQADNGMTALHQAVWQRSTDIVALLLEHHADKTIQDDNGITPWQLATVKEGEAIKGWGIAKAPDADVIGQLE